MKSSKHIKYIIAFAIILPLVINIMSFHTTSATNEYELKESKVKNSSGVWAESGGAYNEKWDHYNCYAFALHREENANFYVPDNVIEYQPGHMSGATAPGQLPSFTRVAQLARLVRDDLTAMGYTNVTLSSTLPTIDSTQELICVRITNRTYAIDNEERYLYHFMRYDYDTEAWYHKPGQTFVLKYNGAPQDDRIWTDENSTNDGESAGSVIYNSKIVYITYTKKQINVSASASSTQSINPGKDVFCEVNFEYAGGFNLQLSSQYSFEYELYNDSFDIVSSGSGSSINTSFSVNEGRYYLRMNFENVLSSSNSVNVSFSHIGHSYTDHYINYTTAQHKSCCGCGEYTLNNHVVAQGALPDSNGYGICILCRGQVFMGNLNSIPGSDMPHTANGSYILQNGVVVLVDEDIEAYMNGTLVFYTGEVQ